MQKENGYLSLFSLSYQWRPLLAAEINMRLASESNGCSRCCRPDLKILAQFLQNRVFLPSVPIQFVALVYNVDCGIIQSARMTKLYCIEDKSYQPRLFLCLSR